MKLNNLRQLIKEELKRALNENMFKAGDMVNYMGEKHKVVSDDGYVVKLTTMRGEGKKEVEKTLNYAQVKEKVRKLNEGNADLKDTPLNQIEPGHYLVKYTTDNRSGMGEIEYEFTDRDKLSDVNSYNFWRGVAKEDNLFGKGDSVVSVEKI
jgi:Golgi nucleoside diphosphatase